jgi:hypothetical protein
MTVHKHANQNNLEGDRLLCEMSFSIVQLIDVLYIVYLVYIHTCVAACANLTWANNKPVSETKRKLKKPAESVLLVHIQMLFSLGATPRHKTVQPLSHTSSNTWFLHMQQHRNRRQSTRYYLYSNTGTNANVMEVGERLHSNTTKRLSIFAHWRLFHGRVPPALPTTHKDACAHA